MKEKHKGCAKPEKVTSSEPLFSPGASTAMSLCIDVMSIGLEAVSSCLLDASR